MMGLLNSGGSGNSASKSRESNMDFLKNLKMDSKQKGYTATSSNKSSFVGGNTDGNNAAQTYDGRSQYNTN